MFCEVKTQIVGGTVVSRQAQYYYYTDFVRHLQDSGANTENSTEKTASLRQCVLILHDQHNDQFHQRKSLAGIFLFLLHFISTFY